MKTSVHEMELGTRRKYYSTLIYKYPGEIFLFVACDKKNELNFDTRL